MPFKSATAGRAALRIWLTLEIVEGRKVPHGRTQEDVGCRRLELFARDRVEHDLRRAREQIEGAGPPRAGVAARIAGNIDGNRDVGLLHYEIEGNRIDVAAVDQEPTSSTTGRARVGNAELAASAGISGPLSRTTRSMA